MRKLYIVVGNGELHYCRLSDGELDKATAEDKYDYAYIGPFKDVDEARQYAVKYLISLSRDGFHEEAEELVPYIFEGVI